MGTGSSFSGSKEAGREDDHSSPLSSEVKNAWSYTSTPQYVFLAWCLVKHRDNFTIYACKIKCQYNLSYKYDHK